MKIAIKKRPLSQYYLWKLSNDYGQKAETDPTVPPIKQMIGQLKAERHNLEKVSGEIVSVHISSLAFLEDFLQDVPEHSYRKLLQELQEIFIYRKEK